ncbi:MAG TPA: phosphate acyltransferase PlsX [Epulopiscium sp.]|nr:phosphate acyltransferase PlsX [Candidatus Epulonipiscium sp.]
MPKIAIDVMSGDHAPLEIIKGCVEASQETDATLILVGNKEIITNELKKYTYQAERIEIVDAQEVITMEDSPVMAIRRKKDSSMVVGLNLVKDKKADGLVSAGNTGALLAGGTLLVGRLKGVERPALASLIPVDKGFSLLMDCGANVDAKASYLMQFAQMGHIYMKELMTIDNPSIGLINIGVEEEKGNAVVKETFGLLKASNLNFVGNIEARDISLGQADILICDGFVGNVVLKQMEGFGMWIFKLLKEELTKNWVRKMGAMIIMPALKSLKNRFDYAEQGGAPLLGLNGLVLKTHGSAKAKQIKHTILQGVRLAEQDVVSKIEQNINM